jgi:hypothetical protein
MREEKFGFKINEYDKTLENFMEQKEIYVC